ncbi:hypothetical protein LJC06_04880, partial [Bacteroidales bacterium OttesenSCG-928-I14]|nr:hypothetical protein [Bacteroidales bacterium OttesenSCG-928-I14]
MIIGGEHGSNLTIDDGATDNVVLKSVEFKGKDADLHLSPNYKNVSMTIKEDLIINTSRLDFTAYEIKFIVEGNLKFKRLDTAIQFGGRATQYPENGKYTFTLAGVDFSEASASVCGQQVNWLAWIPTELISSSNSQIEFENTEFQNITFSKGSYSGAGTAFSSPKSGDLIGNSGDITWTASSETAITYYWIGGAGDWNDPAHWSKTSGGTSSGCAPSASDNVIMDNNSGLGNQYSQQTITIPTNAICNNITWTTPGKLTMSANSSLSIRGNADFSGATQISGTVSFLGSDESGNYTLNSGANAIYNECLIVFQNKGTYTLTSPLLSTIKSSILQYGGTFVSGGYKIEVTTISSTISRPATATRNLDLRNSEITFNGNAEPMIVGNAKTFDRTGMGYCYMEGSHFILDGQTMGIRTVGVFEFNNITSISTYNPGLDFVDPGNTINKLTLKENFGISTDAGFTVKDLIMTSGRTYTLGYYIGSAQSEIDKVTVTVTGSIDPGTSDCDKIFFKSDYPSRPAYLKNGTTGTLSMAGADMADIHYIGNSETDKLQVPNGTDRGGLVNVNLTEPEGRDMFWVGNGGNFSDGSHWSFTSGGEASGCVPNRNDNIIFDEKSFTTTNQVVTADYEVEAVNMTWTAEAAAKTPTLRLGKTMTLRGSMLLNQGMNMR